MWRYPNKKTTYRFIAKILIPIIIVIIIRIVTFSTITESAQPLQTIPTPAPKTYHVAGKYIIDNQGNIFIPYGMQLDGPLMAQSNWATDSALTYLTQSQVQAAHDFWHANTVSLQLGSRAFFDQSPYDTTYLAAVDNVVTWARQLGMNVLLVLQYEGVGNSSQPMPTQDSINFWEILSKHYATSPNVFFDVFNEPNPAIALGIRTDNNKVWSFWQFGGVVNGTYYVGMQQLVNAIRNNGFKNLVFVDGTASGEDIRLLPHFTLAGSNIVYAIHPYLNKKQHSTKAQWATWFGNAAAAGNFPVVADEWGQYQDNYYGSSPGSCMTDAHDVVPQFLAYLRSKHIGLIGYALFPGTLIRGWNFTDPTAFDQNPETCPITSSHDYSSNAQGAGQLLEQYFALYSKQ